MMTTRRKLLVIWLVAISNLCEAKDFGIAGNSFKVSEEGFIAMIERKLKRLDIKTLETKMQNIAEKKVEEPLAVAGITKTIKHREFNYDPSYTLAEDIYLPNGKLLYIRGTTVNPLDHMSWQGKLVFIDSRDNEQVAWVKQRKDLKLRSSETMEMETAEEQAKIVLVAGKPLELERELGIAIYFDQSGELTTKFGIRQVPAIVEQEGKMLKVSEIKI